MNRLGKPRPGGLPPTAPAARASSTTMSRTMRLAVSGASVLATSRGDDSSSAPVDLQRQRKRAWFSAPGAAAPRTTAEHYWAVRALVAETLLSAHDRHQDELADMRRIEEQKREREIGIILHAHHQRQKRLERFMGVCLAVLLGFTCWLVTTITPDRDAKGRSSKPSHFTIPILSPFASVVEHETGVVGTRAVTIFVLAVGLASYAVFKHQLSQRHTR